MSVYTRALWSTVGQLRPAMCTAGMSAANTTLNVLGLAFGVQGLRCGFRVGRGSRADEQTIWALKSVSGNFLLSLSLCFLTHKMRILISS